MYSVAGKGHRPRHNLLRLIPLRGHDRFLSVDAQEQSNVLRSNPDIYEALRGLHSSWKLARHGKAGFSQPAELSREQLEVLRSLGYVE